MKIIVSKIKMLGSIALLLLFVQSISAQMKVHFINVGQGSSCLVEFPCGAVLIDAGGEKNSEFDSNEELKKYLKKFFERRPDLKNTLQCLYITHPHSDHMRGVPTLLAEKYTIKNLVTNGMETGSNVDYQGKMHELAQNTKTNTTKADDIELIMVKADNIKKGGLTNGIIDPINCDKTNPVIDPVITVLWGEMLENPGMSNAKFYNPNNNSLVIKIAYGKSSLLITGDLEDDAIEFLLDKYKGTDILDVDLYVAGHHGSMNGTTEDFLKAITPKYAVISMGDLTSRDPKSAWNYGHPNKGILEMLEEKIIEKRKTPIKVDAGLGSGSFVTYTVTKAIYATGWDIEVDAVADANGTWSINGDAVSKSPSSKLLNINTATKSELMELPRIAEVKAKAILNYRKLHGPFKKLEEVGMVPGIAEKTLEIIGPYIRFD